MGLIMPETQDNNYKYQNQVQKFVQLVFEDSKDYSLLLEIVSTVGINTVFPCWVLWKDDDDTEIRRSDYGETTFLSVALFYKNEKVIRLLLENGADPNVKDGYEEPPIWELQYEYEDAEYGLRVTRLLLEYGANPNIEWDTPEGFYTYVDTKPLDIIGSEEELHYLRDLAKLLEEFGGRYDWEK